MGWNFYDNVCDGQALTTFGLQKIEIAMPRRYDSALLGFFHQKLFQIQITRIHNHRDCGDANARSLDGTGLP